MKTEPKRKKRLQDSENRQRFPELYRSDVSIHPSYTGLLIFPYDIICRRRLVQKKRLYAMHLNRELDHFIAMKMQAIDGIRLEMLFTIQD